MDVTLYKNTTAEENSVDKALVQVAKYSDAQLVGEVTTDTPSIRLNVPTSSLGPAKVNYFEWNGAYYFLRDVIMHVNGSSTIVGAMDYLYTYKTAIRGWNALLDRETRGTLRAVDEGRLVSADSARAVFRFPIPIDTTEQGGLYVAVTSQNGYTIA